ncbi:hypothetical protein BDV12DRAFT_195211 [Aspergillus spectabilis]
MQRPQVQPSPTCLCLPRTAQILQSVPNLLSVSTPEPVPISVPLDEILRTGSALVNNWALLHACPDTSAHLDAHMLQGMVTAAIQTLTLYEAAVESSFSNDWVEGDARDQPDGENSNTPTAMKRNPITVTKGSEPAHLGRMSLDDDEMAIVAREALRYETMRLGEMLHDIEEDMSRVRGRDDGLEDVDVDVDVREVRRVTASLLGLLGRINR